MSDSRTTPGERSAHGAARRRRLLLALAALGLAIAAYLTLSQLGLLARPWDPVFGPRSSREVLELTAPVPDAAAGVLAYAVELVLLIAAGRARRPTPWVGLALGAVLLSGAVVSVLLIATQAVIADAWCLLCLASAGVSFALFALGIGEGRDALSAVRRARRRGAPLDVARRGA